MYWEIKSLHGNYNVTTGVEFGEITNFLTNNKDVILFVDENVLIHWPILNGFNPISVTANEETKTMVGVQPLIDAMIERGANPKSKIMAIGGGVVQDAVGFIASIWCRGIDYILVPTTLLSQVDSCVGGKTSINHIRKNILGTFWPPKQILICTDFLKTLSQKDYWSGWGEWIKYNILRDKTSHTIDTLSGDIVGNELTTIVDGLDYKIGIIQRDEFDKGERKFLNFGHTFGHALESVSSWEIPHGYAIFIGSLIALSVSTKYTETNLESDLNKLFLFAKEYLQRGNVIQTLKREWFTSELIEIAKKSDKKQENNAGIRMVLIGENGPYLHNVEDNKVLVNSIQRVCDEICI